MATNNAVNITSSGIVSYDGAGTFSALANPLTVSNGGSGVSSFTAYAVLCGGTTSTGVLQNVSGLGNSGQVLKSNGAGALPTWQSAPSSTKTGFKFAGTIQAADGVTYWYSSGLTSNSYTSFSAIVAMIVPRSGTINTVYGVATVGGTLGSTENCTVAIRVNNTSDTNITTTFKLNAASQTFNTTTLGVSVSAGDYISLKFICPTFVTNPTSASLSATVVLD